MKTIRYYVNGRYMGWEKLDNNNLLTYKNWLNSGNQLMIDKTVISTIKELFINGFFDFKIKG